MEIRPLSPALGAEVVGLDLTRSPTAGAVETLRCAFLDYHLLCFRAEPLDAGDFARLAHCEMSASGQKPTKTGLQRRVRSLT